MIVDTTHQSVSQFDPLQKTGASALPPLCICSEIGRSIRIGDYCTRSLLPELHSRKWCVGRAVLRSKTVQLFEFEFAVCSLLR